MYLMKLRVWNYKINSQTIQKNLTTKEFFLIYSHFASLVILNLELKDHGKEFF